jgi:transcriptional regulator of acetoin/glycerol metabolism
MIERLLIMTDGDSIDVADVEDALPVNAGDEPVSEIRAARDKAERDTILAMLRECQWNVSETSRRLGMDRGYLHRKIKRYGLTRDGAV